MNATEPASDVTGGRDALGQGAARLLRCAAALRVTDRAATAVMLLRAKVELSRARTTWKSVKEGPG
jgi:hypothetical protein